MCIYVIIWLTPLTSFHSLCYMGSDSPFFFCQCLLATLLQFIIPLFLFWLPYIWTDMDSLHCVFYIFFFILERYRKGKKRKCRFYIFIILWIHIFFSISSFISLKYIENMDNKNTDDSLPYMGYETMILYFQLHVYNYSHFTVCLS